MLTKTQLSSAETAELERLKGLIETELAHRKEQQEARREPKEPESNERLYFSSQEGHYQWEYRRCGHKERCKRCKSGEKHGPYLYRYFYRDGKYRSQYVKLSELDKHPEAPPRPVAGG